MKYRMLGALKVSAVGLGCTFFDTADNPHDNEELVGCKRIGSISAVSIGRTRTFPSRKWRA